MQSWSARAFQVVVTAAKEPAQPRTLPASLLSPKARAEMGASGGRRLKLPIMPWICGVVTLSFALIPLREEPGYGEKLARYRGSVVSRDNAKHIATEHPATSPLSVSVPDWSVSPLRENSCGAIRTA